MNKTIYVSDKNRELFIKAQKILGQKSISATISEALRFVIFNKSAIMAANKFADEEFKRQCRGTSKIKNPTGILNCPGIKKEAL